MKTNKIYIIAALLLLVGLAIAAGASASIGFDWSKLNSENYIEKEFTADGKVLKLFIDDSNNKITVETIDSDRLKIEYVENERGKYIVKQSGTNLTITKESIKPFGRFFNFGFNFKSNEMRIYIPADTAIDLNIETSNSAVDVNGVKCTDLKLKTSNGSIDVSDVFSERGAVCDTSNGAIKISRVNAAGTLDCDSSNGRIVLSDARAETIIAKTSNASINLSNLTAINIKADTSSGSIDITGLEIGRELRLDTSNAGISGTLPGKISDYNITSLTSNGSNSLPDKLDGGDKTLIIKTSNGSIRLEFEK